MGYVEQKFQLDSNQQLKADTEYLQKVVDLQELHTKLKRRKLGNISFIGELCKMNLISAKIIHDCIWQLLVDQPEHDIKNFSWKTLCDEDEIEVLCKLFVTVGFKLDADDSKKHRDNLALVFKRLHELSSDKSLNSRMRFALRGVVENHANGWCKSKRYESGNK